MAMRLGVQYDIMDIEPIVAAFAQVSTPIWVGIDADMDANCNVGISAGISNPAPVRSPEDKTAENIQARIRGTLLMGISNRSGAIVLTAANKSDLAVGYCTLYGDMAGGFAVIKDISKTLVYRLCQYRNGGVGCGVGGNVYASADTEKIGIIPEGVLRRPPSAELRQGQTDLDDLPPYEALDAIMRLYIEEDCSPADIVAQGFLQQHVDWVTQLIKRSEYKRRQAPIGIRVTPRAFGRDWRYPVTSRYVDRVTG
jgi:NAD+ synthase (glutamine-hydrolysing)